MQETGRQGKYHVTILPERTYANFYLTRDEFCHFTNDGYLSILRIIGKYTYHTETIREICGKLRDDYNCYYHYNRIRHSKRRITRKQIESLFGSFSAFSVRWHNERIVVRIPFSLIPLINYILIKYNEVADKESSMANEIDRNSIGDVLCKEQIHIVRVEMRRLISTTTDEKYAARCNMLEREMLNNDSLLWLNWHEWQSSSVDFAEEHWLRYR